MNKIPQKKCFKKTTEYTKTQKKSNKQQKIKNGNIMKSKSESMKILCWNKESANIINKIH